LVGHPIQTLHFRLGGSTLGWGKSASVEVGHNAASGRSGISALWPTPGADGTRLGVLLFDWHDGRLVPRPPSLGSTQIQSIGFAAQGCRLRRDAALTQLNLIGLPNLVPGHLRVIDWCRLLRSDRGWRRSLGCEVGRAGAARCSAWDLIDHLSHSQVCGDTESPNASGRRGAASVVADSRPAWIGTARRAGGHFDVVQGARATQVR
jgi:hypothetical protein